MARCQRQKNDPSTQSLHTVQQSAYDDRRTPVFILTFLKNNPTQEYHAAGFDMFLNNGVGNGSIHSRPCCEMLQIWPECFRRKPWPSSKRYLRKEVGKKSSTSSSLYYGEGDSPAERSGSSSGLLQREKKKKHTVKNAVITTLPGLVLFVGATVPGKTHDKTIAERQYAFPYPCIL